MPSCVTGDSQVTVAYDKKWSVQCHNVFLGHHTHVLVEVSIKCFDIICSSLSVLDIYLRMQECSEYKESHP